MGGLRKLIFWPYNWFFWGLLVLLIVAMTMISLSHERTSALLFWAGLALAIVVILVIEVRMFLSGRYVLTPARWQHEVTGTNPKVVGYWLGDRALGYVEQSSSEPEELWQPVAGGQPLGEPMSYLEACRLVEEYARANLRTTRRYGPIPSPK